jgi:hypothetical protein
MAVPHDVPFGRSVISVHTAVPVAQLISATRQGLSASVQAPPAVHAAQAPLLQTWLVPHTVPFA